MLWTCKFCGHEHAGDSPPAECPYCNESGNFFYDENGDYWQE